MFLGRGLNPGHKNKLITPSEFAICFMPGNPSTAMAHLLLITYYLLLNSTPHTYRLRRGNGEGSEVEQTSFNLFPKPSSPTQNA